MSLPTLCQALRRQGGLVEFFFIQEWYDRDRRAWPLPMADGPLWSMTAWLDEVDEAFFAVADVWRITSGPIWFMNHRHARSEHSFDYPVEIERCRPS